MSKRFLLCMLCALPFASFADEAAAPASAASAASPASPASAPEPMAAAGVNDVCLIQGVPPASYKYVVLRKVVAKKGTYGSVAEMLPGLASQAQALGGTALINYNGGQHFGFWPWRLARPIVSGTAIRWEGASPDCTAAGGATVGRVMATNTEPKRLNPPGAASSEPAQR